MSEKPLESSRHDRRLSPCGVYLTLFLTAMFLSVLTPRQPHLARTPWVSRQAAEGGGTKQAVWMELTRLGCDGASLPDADNSGARGRGLKPEALAWYFKRPEWLWSQLSINSKHNQAKQDLDWWKKKKKRRQQKTEYWQKSYFLLLFFCNHDVHLWVYSIAFKNTCTFLFKPRLLPTITADTIIKRRA